MNKEGRVLEQLLSTDIQVVKAAVEEVRQSNNPLFIQPMVALFISTENIELKEDLRQMLNTLKVKGFEDELMKCLRKEAWKMDRGAIMAFIWNSGGNPTSYMTELLQMAVLGGAETMLECFSIIEVMEGPLTEEQLIDSQQFLHEAHQKETDEYKKNLIALLSNAMADKEIDID